MIRHWPKKSDSPSQTWGGGRSVGTPIHLSATRDSLTTTGVATSTVQHCSDRQHTLLPHSEPGSMNPLTSVPAMARDPLSLHQPTSLRLPSPYEVTHGTNTPASGSSSPDVFFDAADNPPPLVLTPTSDALEDLDEYHETFQEAQEDARLERESNIYIDQARSKNITAVMKGEMSDSTNGSRKESTHGDTRTRAENDPGGDISGNILCDSLHKCGFLFQYENGHSSLSKVNVSANYTLDENSAACGGCSGDQGNNVDSEQVDSSHMIRTYGYCWEDSKSSCIRGYDDIGCGEGDMNNLAGWSPENSSSVIAGTCGTTTDIHLSSEPALSVIPVSLPHLSTADGAGHSSPALGKTLVEHDAFHDSTSGLDWTPTNESSHNFYSDDFTGVCHRETNTADEAKPTRHRLLREFVSVQKIPGNNLREETRRIVMMLGNDKSCRVPRPSLGLQDRVKSLVQHCAGKRTAYVKGPRFCSTVVKNIVRQSHDRLHSCRDSFQEFIQTRKDQCTQKVFTNPMPCYGMRRTSSGDDVGPGSRQRSHTSGNMDTVASMAPSLNTVRPAAVSSITDNPKSSVQDYMHNCYRNREEASTLLPVGGYNEMTVYYKLKINPSNHIVKGSGHVESETLVTKEMLTHCPDQDIQSLSKAVQPQSLVLDTKANDQDFMPSCTSMSKSTTADKKIDSEYNFNIVYPTTSLDENCVPSEKIHEFDSKDEKHCIKNEEIGIDVKRASKALEELDNSMETDIKVDYRYREGPRLPTSSFPTDHCPMSDAPDMIVSSTLIPNQSKKLKNTPHKINSPDFASKCQGSNVDLQAPIDSLNKVSLTAISKVSEVSEDGRGWGNHEEVGGASGGDHSGLTPPHPASMQGSPLFLPLTDQSSLKPIQTLPEKSPEKHKQHIEPAKIPLESTNQTVETKSTKNSDITTKNMFTMDSSSESHSRTCVAHWSTNSDKDSYFKNDVSGNNFYGTSSRESTGQHLAQTSHLTKPHDERKEPPSASLLCTFLEDITKLKTDNLVARYGGIRSQLYPISAPLHQAKPTPSPSLEQPNKPLPSTAIVEHGTVATINRNEEQFPGEKGGVIIDGRPPHIKQGSINEKRHVTVNNRQSSVDERLPPNIRQGSIDGQPPLPQKSKQRTTEDLQNLSLHNRTNSVDKCSGQRTHINIQQNNTNNHIPSQPDGCRSRTNSSQRGSIKYGSVDNRNGSMNTTYLGGRRDSKSVRNRCSSRRGSRASFGQDLLRKCLEVAVEMHGTTERIEIQRERDTVKNSLSSEELNKSLGKAVCSHDADKARSLLKLGADPNVSCGHSPALLRAAKDGALYVLQALLAAGADVDVRSELGNSPLHVAARAGYSEVAVQLVQSGAFVDAINRSGVTPLQMALAHGHLEVAQTLLRFNADIFLPNKIGETAYELMNQLGYVGLSASPRELRRDSAPGTRVEPSSTETPVAVKMILGIEEGCPVTVETCLAEGAPPNTVVPLALHWPAHATVLHRASHHGHDLIVRLLLAAGAEVNRQDVVGNTPLHAAAQAGHNRVVKILLGHGARLEATSKSGMTPLHRAASKGKELTCNLLLRRGSNPQAEDTVGRTPADWARKRGFKSLAKKLVYRRKSSETLLAECDHHHYINRLNQLHEAALKGSGQDTSTMSCEE
ncbi:uncharacterized protein [Procambarus clarkii]|uniref:uncharacterized protein n=1 Tax=Procambarus clarkii TaxID=6728 RepID=UPI0037432E37